MQRLYRDFIGIAKGYIRCGFIGLKDRNEKGKAMGKLQEISICITHFKGCY